MQQYCLWQDYWIRCIDDRAPSCISIERHSRSFSKCPSWQCCWLFFQHHTSLVQCIGPYKNVSNDSLAYFVRHWKVDTINGVAITIFLSFYNLVERQKHAATVATKWQRHCSNSKMSIDDHQWPCTKKWPRHSLMVLKKTLFHSRSHRYGRQRHLAFYIWIFGPRQQEKRKNVLETRREMALLIPCKHIG